VLLRYLTTLHVFFLLALGVHPGRRRDDAVGY
jgi:hypothetical protein